MINISTKELIMDNEIEDIKNFVGPDLELKLYIHPRGEDIIWWTGEEAIVEAKTVEPYKWQLHAMRETFQRVNDEFGITLTEVFDKKDSDISIKLTEVHDRYAVNGTWAPDEWDPLWINKVHIIMTKDEWGQEDWVKAEWKKVFIHEIGHLLGLEHPWDKPDGDWAVKNAKVKTIHTIMGYDQEDPTGKVMDWFQDVDQRALRQIWDASIATPKPTPLPEPEPEDSIIESVRGKGKLKGTNVADAFIFASFEAFTKKAADKIIGFDASQGDTIAVSPNAFPALQGASAISFVSTNNKKDLKSLGKQDYDFVYFEKKGKLYFDGNGSDKKWGDSSEGGLVAILKGRPELTQEDFTLLA